jgi:hypothetical protein
MSANYIAKWNGSNWSSLGSGVGRNSQGYPWVLALAASGNALYAGGYFSIAGGKAVHQVAKWDGTNWSALGSGINDFDLPRVGALAISGGSLYVGGKFTLAGGKASLYAAKVLLDPLAFDSNTVAISNGTFQALLTGPEYLNVVIETSTNLAEWIPLTTDSLPPGGWQLSLPASTNRYRFYRARLGP